MPVSLLYWSLVLGVGIGGNLTPIASMCNIVGNNLIRKLKKRVHKFFRVYQKYVETCFVWCYNLKCVHNF